MELTEEQQKRFWDKVDKTDSCWLWTGCVFKSGYGAVSINCKTYISYRISWLLFGNTIPEGHVIRHKCRSKKCVNPTHLETGTYAENAEDKKRDKTQPLGEQCNLAKLTATQVHEIRARASENHYTLAEEYGVNQSTIWRLVNRRRWKHI